ncbi:MAG: hypothetical protein M1827_005044 [Pycnora praestabilis]|nr:MAG: hypothetical protein M1827_005044 [Pycnora praestabilis]
MSLAEKLDKIRSSKLQNQHSTIIVLNAVEDTLRDQKTTFTPTAYFAAIVALLSQSISSSNGVVNKELATSVVYLLDLVTPYVPQPLLRSKFSPILTNLAPTLTYKEAEAPLLRSSIGCLESLLVAQDRAAWDLPQTQIGPRRAMAGLMTLSVDHRPKVRKRAQGALTLVLKTRAPGPALDHPAADMCAEMALRSLSDLATAAGKNKRQRRYGQDHQHDPGLIHALQLVRTITAASGGWPSRKIEPLCEVLLDTSKSNHDYLTTAAFELFEIIFEGMAEESSSAKLPRLLEVIAELQPSHNDSQLLPPWIAVISRGYDVSAQMDPGGTFEKLPELFTRISGFLTSSSHTIRISAAECLVSFMLKCVPHTVLSEPSIYDQKNLEKLGKQATELLSVKYQGAWMEVFTVLGAMFDAVKWRCTHILSEIVKTVGGLRGSESFSGKKEADELIGKAIKAIGPAAVLDLLPLNLATPEVGQPGRAWLLPILRDFVENTTLAHFKTEFLPLSEVVFQRVIDNGQSERSMETKIFETLVQQIWALLPGYCDLPLDLTEAFDQGFAEIVSNLLYKQTDLRADVCKALQRLIDSNNDIVAWDGNDDNLLLYRRVSKAKARENIAYLATFASNMLAVLFNVYSQTLPQHRAFILRCINSFLSITPEKELMETFKKVTAMLESSLDEQSPQTQAEKQQQQKHQDPESKMPPMSYTLMDLVITMALYLPRDSFASLFNMASLIINNDDDAQLQKKAYKLIPRLAGSQRGRVALKERNEDLQQLLLNSARKTSAPARRDRLAAISQIIEFLPATDLHFIPSILSEIVISTKEVNEKARTAAFNVLVLMGETMQRGGTVVNARVSHMPNDASEVQASLEEYFTMVSAGLAGATPHMVSASITALSRILYHFRETLSEVTVTDLVQTMDLFLTSSNREIVQSVLGFVKVSVISLSTALMLPRLETLIPNMMVWSHEHKAHFKAKVKHIIERMIRRFGVEIVNKWCPEDDKKLISNIRKTRERKKRRKEAGDDGEEQVEDGKKKSRFESEYDEAVYGSDESDIGSDISDDEVLGPRKGSKREKGRRTFIVEDEDEPLDLLDRKALANISSTRPLNVRQPPSNKSKAKVNEDGKLLINGDEDDEDAMMMDSGEAGAVSTTEPGDGTLEGGINAYVDAIKGRDAVQKGQRGKLKFSNKKSEHNFEMEIDQAEVKQKITASQQLRGGPKEQRKGLRMEKTRVGRVGKSPRGRSGKRCSKSFRVLC